MTDNYATLLDQNESPICVARCWYSNDGHYMTASGTLFRRQRALSPAWVPAHRETVDEWPEELQVHHEENPRIFIIVKKGEKQTARTLDVVYFAVEGKNVPFQSRKQTRTFSPREVAKMVIDGAVESINTVITDKVGGTPTHIDISTLTHTLHDAIVVDWRPQIMVKYTDYETLDDYNDRVFYQPKIEEYKRSLKSETELREESRIAEIAKIRESLERVETNAQNLRKKLSELENE